MDPNQIAPVYDAATSARHQGMFWSEEDLQALGPPPDPVRGTVTWLDFGQCIRNEQYRLFEWCLFNPRQRGSDDDGYSRLRDAPRWRQVSIKPRADSLGKTPSEQLALLGPGERLPLARVVASMMVVHCLATGERLLRDVAVRCGDLLPVPDTWIEVTWVLNGVLGGISFYRVSARPRRDLGILVERVL